MTGALRDDGPTDDDRDASESAALDVHPTADDGTRLIPTAPWDESSRPHRPRSGSTVKYTEAGRKVAQMLIDVHDMLRTELTQLREILSQVREGHTIAGAARSALHGMALRQNDWTVGALCSRYCSIVTQHHGIEDDLVFPSLAEREPQLQPVLRRLTDEHRVIHDAIDTVDHALVEQLTNPDDHRAIQAAIDSLTDSLLSHLSYEENELVEPLARLGFFAGQF